MPTTINGIGTHYYGKSKVQTRSGVCRSCRTNATLSSYDTTLWFVVIFIPIIPLGRKRIMDQCSRCSRHYVLAKANYESLKNTNVSSSLEQYREQPTPEAAASAHANLVSFHMYDEAAKFRTVILADHAENADLHVAIAAQLGQMGKHAEAQAMMEKVYELKPDMPAARVSVAQIRMNQGKLDEARKLLSFLTEPGAGKSMSLEPLEVLARAYQKQGRHQETIDLCKFLISELPKIGTIRSFRKLVGVSEKALQSERPLASPWETNGGGSILPKRSFSLRGLLFSNTGEYSVVAQRWAYAAIIFVLLFGGFGTYNEYTRRHRTLTAMNNCGQGEQLSIDGGAPMPFDQTLHLTLAEGRHHVAISGDLSDEFDIDMSTKYFERFYNRPAWAIMAGGGTALWEKKIIYHVVGQPHNVNPSDPKLIIGERFYYAPHVDYAFVAPPRTIEMDNKGAITKIQLALATGDDHDLIWYAYAERKTAEAMTFSEAHLIADRKDINLLTDYSAIAFLSKQEQRATEFLKLHLDRQPLSVPWHRSYQDFARMHGGDEAIAALYDAKLKTSPHNSDLLYLRGRVEDDTHKARDFFTQAREADPKSPWPYYALAVDAADFGDWGRCRTNCQSAMQSLKSYPPLRQMYRRSMMGLGEFATLEDECHQVLVSDSSEEKRFAHVIELFEVLAAQGKSDEVKEAFFNWRSKLPAADQDSAMVSMALAIVHYMIGDFKSLKDDVGQGHNRSDANIRLSSLLVLGQLDEIAGDDSFNEVLGVASNLLSLSLANSIRGKREEAALWREKAAVAFDRMGGSAKRTAVLLRRSTAPTREQSVVSGSAGENLVALVAADLAFRFPEHKAEYLAMAERLNVGRAPPYQLVRLALKRASL